ncbi:uncharacterized protein LOC143460902 [Clavelina lepadiformis]|uniref:Uncharacterized protein n=1 Tax=Clavelina lepadiformis TaxID=159417 RepID=A0ABP0GE66_CLALP
MPESEEERKKRWAAAAAKSYMTPTMMHALNMSKQQSQNKYKELFDKTKAKGYTPISSTPEIENAKRMSKLVSQNKYKSDFEKNKAKFTQVADDPETVRVTRVTNQISSHAYHGKGTGISKTRKRKDPNSLAENKSQTTNNAVQTSNENADVEVSCADADHDEETSTQQNKSESIASDEGKTTCEQEKEDAVENESSAHENRDITKDETPPTDSPEEAQGEEESEQTEQYKTENIPAAEDTEENPDNRSQEENVYDPVTSEEHVPNDEEATYETTEDLSYNYGNEEDFNQASVEPEEAIYSEVAEQEQTNEDETAQGGNSLDDFYANLE